MNTLPGPNPIYMITDNFQFFGFKFYIGKSVEQRPITLFVGLYADEIRERKIVEDKGVCIIGIDIPNYPCYIPLFLSPIWP
jgi:hypothetical protein